MDVLHTRWNTSTSFSSRSHGCHGKPIKSSLHPSTIGTEVIPTKENICRTLLLEVNKLPICSSQTLPKNISCCFHPNNTMVSSPEAQLSEDLNLGGPTLCWKQSTMEIRRWSHTFILASLPPPRLVTIDSSLTHHWPISALLIWWHFPFIYFVYYRLSFSLQWVLPCAPLLMPYYFSPFTLPVSLLLGAASAPPSLSLSVDYVPLPSDARTFDLPIWHEKLQYEGDMDSFRGL